MEFDDIILRMDQFLTESRFSVRLEPVDRLFEERVRVGLDIGARTLKLVQIRETPRGPELTAWGLKEIPAAGSERDTAFVQAVRDLWLEKKIRTRRVRVVVSDPKIYLRHITIPVVPEDELVKAVKWQAEKHVPFPIEHAVVDFQILKSRMRDGERQMELLIVAAENAVIEKYMAVLKEARLVPVTLDAAPFAVARALLGNYSFAAEDVVPLVDIGENMTSIVVIRDGNLQMVRSMEFGTGRLMDNLSKELGISHPRAVGMVKQFSWEASAAHLGNGAKVRPALETFFSELAGQLNRSLAYCEQEFINEKIKQIYFCGGGAQIPGLRPYLSKQLGLHSELVDPFRRVAVPGDDSPGAELKEATPQLSAALGEAL